MNTGDTVSTPVGSTEDQEELGSLKSSSLCQQSPELRDQALRLTLFLPSDPGAGGRLLDRLQR